MQQSFERAREAMVECQVRPNKVTDAALLSALKRIPREKFLPPQLQSKAYVDEDIALGEGRYLLEPFILAGLLQAAGVKKTDTVLDVGCGTGYATAILACLCKIVTGLEQDQKMAAEASRLLERMEIHNAHIVHDDRLQDGHAGKAPYDVILINGAVAAIPDKIKAQLAEGGRLVTVVSRHGHIGSAALVTRHGGNFVTRSVFDAATPFLAGFEEPKDFVF